MQEKFIDISIRVPLFTNITNSFHEYETKQYLPCKSSTLSLLSVSEKSALIEN